ncbi:glycosyltransferase involved in cell wall biosynthesis [Blastococcus colisei]|uniref:Glycosyltransferase involved in cell wall biosynthesis n=1 Tax=Blastococcus colisei TaxID=1564162 RepID=A0A543P1M2_9ACTN|nr:glycosyltransferase [Blastococcus colisei]TQN37987.1 glycosyltransferase involved in cell wall biosynthesis [Blastococcus colisei]
MKVLMDAGPWLPVPPRGYGGLENVVATLTGELRARGHTVVLASVGDSELPADGRVSAFPTGQFAQLAGPYPQVVGIAHAHEQAVLRAVEEHAEAGVPFDVVHTHVEVVGPAILGAMRRAGPPVLATLHWDLGRNSAFYSAFDGHGRVFFVGVSEIQLAAAPDRLRRQVLGSVPLSVPVPQEQPLPVSARSHFVLLLARICELKGTDTALRACRDARLPLVLAGPVAGMPDAAALADARADPRHPVHTHPDLPWFTEHVEPLLDGTHARWIGTVAGPEKARLVREARAVLFPIRWEEPGGTAVCEALAAGTPVVAMARGCLPSLVDDGRTGFLADDEAGFTAALGRLAEIDPTACAAEARRRFAPAVMAERYEELYAEVLRRTDRLTPAERPAPPRARDAAVR